MKFLISTLIGLAMAAFVSTASAYVVEITTSIPAVTAATDDDLRVAVESAIDVVLTRAIGFTPTVVTVEAVRRLGDRIYFTLLILDQDGEELLKQLEADDATAPLEPPAKPEALWM